MEALSVFIHNLGRLLGHSFFQEALFDIRVCLVLLTPGEMNTMHLNLPLLGSRMRPCHECWCHVQCHGDAQLGATRGEVNELIW